MLSDKTKKIFAVAGASAAFAGQMIAMQDPDAKGLDDKIARVVQGVGTGCTHVANGNNKSAADVLDTAAAVLADIAKQLRSGKAPEEI
jgi:hypothetical protein